MGSNPLSQLGRLIFSFQRHRIADSASESSSKSSVFSDFICFNKVLEILLWPWRKPPNHYGFSGFWYRILGATKKPPSQSVNSESPQCYRTAPNGALHGHPVQYPVNTSDQALSINRMASLYTISMDNFVLQVALLTVAIH